jgi:hypothetical protein
MVFLWNKEISKKQELALGTKLIGLFIKII